MIKKRWFFLGISIIVTISIFILTFMGGKFVPVSSNAENVSKAKVNSEKEQFTPFYQKEKEYVNFFYREYQNITNLHNQLKTGKASLEEFTQQIKVISPNVNAQFNKIEDFRLGYRYKISKEDIKSKAYNDLYSYGYRTRWRILNFISLGEQKDLTISLIENKYKEEITEGYELELPVLLELLAMPAAEYPLGEKSNEQFDKNLVGTKEAELRYRLLSIFPELLDINEVQIGKMDDSSIVMVKIGADAHNEELLVLNSREMLGSIFDEFSEISEISLFWQNKDLDNIYVLGFERNAFYSYMDGKRTLHEIPKFRFLYKNSLAVN